MSYIVDLQLFPCIDFFITLLKETNVEICLYETFKKMSFHNRYVVAGANGTVQLTVPVEGGREQKKLITEVEIDNNTDWRKKHWRTLVSAYAKAPFFDYYQEDIKSLIFNKEKKLANFNIVILDKLCNILNVNESINYNGLSRQTVLRDDRRSIIPRNFRKDRLNWKPKYAQVFEDRLGFQPNLSILDLLFNVGPASSEILINSLS